MAACGLVYSVNCFSADQSSVKIIEPKKQVTPVKSAIIDSERFQAGVLASLLSVEDFDTNPAYGLSFSYQLRDSILLMAQYGQSEVGLSTYEEREDRIFLSDSDRQLSYLDVLAGYKLFTARSFLGAKRKYDSDIYLLAGLGQYNFAGENHLGWVLGASYRLVLTDWMVVSMDIKDHIFESRSVFEVDNTKLTQNIEFGFSVNALF